jgi:hypothetical protein
MLTVLLIAAAAAAILWPSPKARTHFDGELGVDIKPPAPRTMQAPSYPVAMEALCVVRKRLAHTSHLTDQERQAITLLTLALVSGGDDE